MTTPLRSADRTTANSNRTATRLWALFLPLLVALSLFGSPAQAQVDVTATAGNPGPVTYATLKLAFDAVNAGTHQGDIAMAITANTVEGATPATLNSSGAGAAIYTSVLIRPTADGVSISGNPASGFGVIQLNGADNVTIDGDNAGTGGTNRNLTIQNTAAATTTYASAVRVALSTLVTTANNVIVRNAIILGSATGRNVAAATSTTGSEHTTYGILVGGGASTVAATTAPSAITSINTTIGGAITATGFTATNNQIDSCARGIALQGSAVTVAPGLVVTNNLIGSATPGNTTTVYSRGMTLQGFDTATISGNTIRNIESFIGTSTAGLSLGDVSATGTNSTVSNNVVTNVFNQSATTFGAYGINVNAGNAITVANNFVAGMNHVMTGGGAFSTTFGVFGIRVGTGLNHKIYYNSVNLTGAHPGTPATNLLSAALAVVGTGQTGLDIRNNALQNILTGGTTSVAHVAIYLPSGGTSAMNLTLNNNGYYHGTDLARQGAGQAGATAGVNFFTTLATLKAYSAGLSVAGTNDNVSFASTAGAPYTSATDLHIPAATATQLESGGAVVTVTTDIDGDARSLTTPDIGADEFVGVFVDLTPPSISYSPFVNTTSTANRLLSTSITDLSGVPTAGAGLPVIYFRKGVSDPFVASACVFVSGSSYDCTIDYTLVTGGSVTAGDLVQYYVAAQDNANNVTTNPSAGAGGFSSNPPAASTPPTTPASYSIAIALSGTLSVGTGGGYPSLTNAGGLFEAMNANVLTGNVTIDILSDLAGETGAVALNQWVEEGVGGYTLLIRPSGAPRTITGSNASALIRLNGADRVTIDGSTVGGTAVGIGGDPLLRELTIQNTNVGTSAVVIAVQSGTNGAQNNTLRNLIVTGQDPTTTLVAIAMGGNTPGTAGTDNDGNRVENCAVRRAFYGIYSAGLNAANPNTGTVITRNDLSSTTVDRIRRVGMFLVNDDGGIVTENSVGGVSTNESADAVGIGIGAQGLDAASVASGNVTNALVARNKIDGISSLSTVGFSAAGIAVAGGTAGPNTIANNMIDGVTSPATSPDIVAGIWVAGVAGSTTNIYANTVALAGDRGVVAAQIGSYAIAITGTNPTVVIKDNILANSQTSGGGVNAKSYSIGMTSLTFGNLDSNYNDFYASGANAGFFRTGSLDTTGTDLATLGAWQTAVSDDANSLAVDPLLTSVTDLHLAAGSPMLNAGVALAAVTVDFDNDPRPLTAPDIGADEIVAGILAFSSATYADSESAGTATITVTRTGGSAGSVSIDYATVAGGTATGGVACGGAVDFISASGTLTFVDSDVSESFTVTLCGDALNETNETVNLALSNPLGGSILGTPSTAVLTINDDDAAPTISITDVTQAELNAGTSLFGFVVSLSAPSGQVVTVHYETNDGSATVANSDYVDIPDTILTFNPGVTVGNVDVTVNGDTAPEATENFFVDLSTASNASILDNQGVGTITNDDASSGPVTVTATAGTPGPTDYPTLNAAFDAINAGTHQGVITIDIVTSITNTAVAVLNSSGAGSASYTSVLVRPSNDAVTVSFPTTTGRGVIELNGADSVTIDGDNPNTAGINRNLTIQNTAANTITFTSVVRVALSTLVTSANNVVVKNSVILGSATGRNVAGVTSTTGSENTTYGILVGGGASTVAATTAPSPIASVTTTIAGAITATGFTADNNSVTACARGIAVQGAAITVAAGLTVTNNFIGSAVPGAATTVYSRGMTLQGFDPATITGNTIQNVESFLGTSIASLSLGDVSATGTNATVARNLISGLFARSTTTFGAWGINVNVGNAIEVSNNFVSNLRHDMTGGAAFSTQFGVFGIRLQSGSNHRVYYNSVNLFGAYPGTPATNLLSAALEVVATAQTGLDIRNNSLSNTITGGTTNIAHVAIYLPASGTNAMNLTLNNNGYFHGTDPARQGVGQAGTTAGTNFFTTLTLLKAYSSTLSVAGTNDNASFATSAPAPYTSASNLHIPPATATQLESGGAIVSVITDIDGDPRSITTPDIGADEFGGTLPAANDISAVAVVTPANGAVLLNGSTTTPQARFRNDGTAVQTNVNVQFTITGPGGFSYLNAQVIPTINPGESALVTFGATAAFTTAGAYTSTATVTTPDAVPGNDSAIAGFTVSDPFNGTFTVGTGGNYASLTNPGGIFAAINSLGASGSIVINLISDLAGETGAVPLNEIAGGFSVTLKPSGAPRIVSGSSTVSLIKLSGVDNVTIDGSLAAGTDRSLTITNAAGGPIVWIATNATSGANNITIKNSNLVGPGALAGQGIIAGSGVTLGAAAEFPNSNNTIQNNSIKSVQNAAFISGNVASFDQNWTITGNDFGSTVVAEKLAFRGMLLGGAANFSITNNNITGVSSGPTSTSTMSGIQLSALLNGGTITGNRISDIKHNNAATATSGTNGIFLAATSAASNVLIANNFISDIASPGTTGVLFSSNGYGIMIATGGGYTIVHNSVLMNTNQGANAATANSAALNLASGLPAGAVDLRDNILANTQTLGTRFAVIDSSTAAVFSSINFNDYFAQNVGSLGGTQTTLANWQTATGQDASSLAVDPLFVTTPAPANLHLQAASPVQNLGTPVATVTVDIDNAPRSLTTPEIGADELADADLAITKTDGVGSVTPGGSTTYTIVASNAGPLPVTGATVADVVPADLTCTWTCSGSGGGTSAAGGSGSINDNTVNLPAGGSVTYLLACTVSPSASGSIVNTATVSSGTPDPNGTNNSATDTDTVVAVTLADVAITKTDGATTAVPGTSVTYTIVATNAGPSPAPTVTVVDNFPASLSGCSTTCAASAGSSCTAGPVAGSINDVANLLVGGTATYTATCNISATATGALINTATATVGGVITDPAPGNNSASDNDTLTPTADVSITKTNGVTQSTPGSPVTYTIVVTNSGPSAAPTVNVLDLFPATLTSCATTCVGSGGGSCTAGPVVGNINENANLPVGGSATYTASCTLSLSATGTLVNTATATVGGGATDPNTADNSATDTDTVGNTIFIDGFESGDTLMWSVTVPITVEAYAVVGVDSDISAATFDYDFSAVKPGEALMATAIAVVSDAAGKPLFVLGARRNESFGELEITLQFRGAGRSQWVPVSEVAQRVQIEWSLADRNSLGHVAVVLDGLVVLRVERYAGTVTPAGATLLRAQVPVEP